MTATSDATPDTAPAALPPLDQRRRWNARGLLELLVPLLALLLLVTAAAASERWIKGTSNFLKLENVLNVLRQLSPIGVVALGMTFAIIAGGIDLSVGSMVAMAGGVGIWTMNVAIKAASILSEMNEARQFQSDPPYGNFTEWLARHFTQWGVAGSEVAGVWIGVVMMLGVALAAGWVNGTLIARGRLAPFIATLGGFAAYRSVALALGDGGEFRAASAEIFPTIGSGGVSLPVEVRPDTAAVLPYPVLIFLALAVMAAVLLNKTRYGRYVIAIGSNERSAVYSAINVARAKVLTYLLVGLTCGVAAMLVGSRLHSISSSQTGNLYELDAIAAVVIGGTRMSGGSGTIFGTVIGVLILGVIGNMLSFLDVSPYLQGLVKGAIIVVAVLIQRIGRRV